MTNTGDAAEQMVRFSLEGTEVALKLTGSAAKNIAAALYSVLKNRDKTKIKGRQRLTSMLKSGRELKVFTVPEKHLKQFAAEAKRYGVVYCALREKGQSADGMVDILVRAEDASKINRIVERFHLAAMDTVSIKQEIEKSKAAPDAKHEEKLLDELLGTSENPPPGRTEKSPPSAPISETPEKTAGSTDSPKKSVREELRQIKVEQQMKQHQPPKRKRLKWKGRESR
ncbi:MAG TPA: PcfB family protein [Candidatus Merdivicinus intestinigallinarum]|nr:PcfB family protein [Candidatus Merdivicinus intestinigallinarum]